MKPRLIFMGSPEFALPTLRALAERYPIAGVVTQPDRLAGRGQKLSPPPVKVLAGELGLPIIQPQKLTQPEALATLKGWAPDLIVVAAFGQILRSQVLELPTYGCLNVHASLLPRWRGAAPIQAAILHGDTESGVTIMKMDPGLDTGPILSQRSTPIRADETAGELATRLAEIGLELLLDTLPDYLGGRLQAQRQDESMATYAPMIEKKEGKLSFEAPAAKLALHVRAFNPWPGAYTTWRGQMLKIHRAHHAPGVVLSPGQTTIQDGLPAIATIQDLLVLDELQPAGKKPMPGKVFLQGARGWGELPVNQ